MYNLHYEKNGSKRSIDAKLVLLANPVYDKSAINILKHCHKFAWKIQANIAQDKVRTS